jgi:DNA-binding Xre family transcriptional regulator
MLRIKLRDAMEAYRQRTGQRLTYEALSERSGISIATLQSMAARPNYNTTLSTVGKLCIVLGCQPGDILELSSESPNEIEH